MSGRLAVLCLALAWTAAAHELVVDIEFARPNIVLTASYGPGEPAAHAEVAVSGSGISQEIAGLTDAEGRFSFAPPSEGDWLVRVDDGYGHVARRLITADWSAGAPPNNRPDARVRAGAGLMLIFGATALFVWGRRRRAQAGAPL